MAMVRINDNIKEEIMPILDDLGLSLSEAINLFLHQIKLNNGIPFNLKRKTIVELNDGYGSYICEFGHLHNYSKLDVEKIEKDMDARTFDNIDDLKKALEEWNNVQNWNV